MKIKTSELSGDALDWAVAKADERRVEYDYQYTDDKKLDGWWQLGPNHWQPLNKYSTDWSKGGPIIRRERISIMAPVVRRIGKEKQALPVDYWRAMIRADENEPATHGKGATELIAAMRCYVASKLGDTVDIPDDLI